MIYTSLLTPDNRKVVIPNGALADSSLINVTAQEKRRLDIKLHQPRIRPGPFHGAPHQPEHQLNQPGTAKLSKKSECDGQENSIEITVPPMGIAVFSTLKGFTIRMRTPPAKLERLPWRARPAASPAEPAKAITDAVSTPKPEAISITSRFRERGRDGRNKKRRKRPKIKFCGLSGIKEKEKGIE